MVTIPAAAAVAAVLVAQQPALAQHCLCSNVKAVRACAVRAMPPQTLVAQLALLRPAETDRDQLSSTHWQNTLCCWTASLICSCPPWQVLHLLPLGALPQRCLLQADLLPQQTQMDSESC